MVVRSIGNSLMVILPDLLGKKITNWFDLVRPLTAFKFSSVSLPSGINYFAKFQPKLMMKLFTDTQPD